MRVLALARDVSPHDGKGPIARLSHTIKRKSTSHHTAGAGATGRAETGGLGMSHTRPLTLGGGDWLGLRGGNVAGRETCSIASRPYTTPANSS